MAYNESMTLDADALEGHPLYLPDGTIPPAHHLNWGTLFYNRERNLAIGTMLRGAPPAAENWGARSGPTSANAVAFLDRNRLAGSGSRRSSPGVRRSRGSGGRSGIRKRSAARRACARAMFPVLSPLEISWAPGERQTIDIVPAPRDEGRAMEWTLIDDVSGQVTARQPFHLSASRNSPGNRCRRLAYGPVPRRDCAAGTQVDGAVRRLSQKMVNLIVRPARRFGSGAVRRANGYVARVRRNGGHAMTSWRESWHYDSVGYSPTVLNTRFRRSNHYYYGLYERYSDIRHYRYLRELAQPGWPRDRLLHARRYRPRPRAP